MEAKKKVSDMIGRSKKAYGFLFAALPADHRQLIADVPQGYAFGIWSFLEKKYRNTEQDSVMALWEKITTIARAGRDIRCIQGSCRFSGGVTRSCEASVPPDHLHIDTAAEIARTICHSSTHTQDQ